MTDKDNEELEVHKDIAAEYNYPYWEVKVYSDPQFPSDQYEFPVRNQSDKDMIFDDDYIHFPCGYCKSEDTKLLWANENLTNAGGSVDYEIRCESCGVYTFYEGQEFS